MHMSPIHHRRRPNTLGIRVEPSVIHVAGDVDTRTAPAFLDALTRCDTDLCIHALDLSGVDFFSSVGAWCFIDRGWPHRPHVPIIASRMVRRVLTVCNIEYLLAPHGWRASLDENVDAGASPPAVV